MKKKILIGSPIRQEPAILKEFLNSLKDLDKEDITVDYYFIDDNVNLASKDLLREFSEVIAGNIVVRAGDSLGHYICTEDTHWWNINLVDKVAQYKNTIIEHCKNEKYDYLFLIDSDLVLNPKTLKHLISTDKDIISEIFWTKWNKYTRDLPQVWLSDEYNLVPKNRYEALSDKEASDRSLAFIEQLKKPGVYEVGGLGACTLVSKMALEKGVNYDEIYNLSFFGEDRHFCIRAAVLGFKLYVDTAYPAYHIYRKEYLKDVEEFKEKYKNNIYYSTMGILKTEAESFAKEFLESFYSCNFKNIGEIQINKYLSAQYVSKLVANRNNIIKYIIENELICTTKLLKVDVESLNEKGTEAVLKCDLHISRRNGLDNVFKTYCCKLILQTEVESNWKIASIQLINNEGNSILGFTLIDLLEERVRIAKDKDNKLTLAMLVRNESNKFIKKVLLHATKYVDNVVILDDASDDNTVEICKSVLKDIPLTIVSNKEQGFHNEILLRKQLWKITVDTNPDWILFLDGDEIFEDKIIDYMEALINQSEFDFYCFRLYDMWDENHYREDENWQAHNYYRPFLIRYLPNFNYYWKETSLHCGRVPINLFELSGCNCYIKLKHLGWSTKELREEKYNRYLQLDPEGKYGSMSQYISILDEKPRLIKWT